MCSDNRKTLSFWGATTHFLSSAFSIVTGTAALTAFSWMSVNLNKSTFWLMQLCQHGRGRAQQLYVGSNLWPSDKLASPELRRSLALNHEGYFQICDLNSCIYDRLESERLNQTKQIKAWKKILKREVDGEVSKSAQNTKQISSGIDQNGNNGYTNCSLKMYFSCCVCGHSEQMHVSIEERTKGKRTNCVP